MKAKEREAVAARDRARAAAAEVAFDRTPWFATDWHADRAERDEQHDMEAADA